MTGSLNVRLCPSTLLLLGFLWFPMLERQFAAAAEVVSLTDATFEHQTQASTGATTGSWLILFSIPTCQRCQTLKPILQELSQDEALYQRSIVLGTVDCTDNTAVCQRFSVTALPTVVYLHKKRLYTFGIAGGDDDDESEEFPSAAVTEQLKNFLLQDFETVEALPIPDPPSLLDSLVWEPVSRLYDAGTQSPLLGMAIITLASMLFLTVLLLVYVLVRGSSATTTTKTASVNKTKKN